MIEVLIILAALFALLWLVQKLFNPVPQSIGDARAGTMLVYYDRAGHIAVKREEYDVTDTYYIQEMAADRLTEKYCVKVELLTVDRKKYVFSDARSSRGGGK